MKVVSIVFNNNAAIVVIVAVGVVVMASCPSEIDGTDTDPLL